MLILLLFLKKSKYRYLKVKRGTFFPISTKNQPPPKEALSLCQASPFPHLQPSAREPPHFPFLWTKTRETSHFLPPPLHLHLPRSSSPSQIFPFPLSPEHPPEPQTPAIAISSTEPDPPPPLSLQPQSLPP